MPRLGRLARAARDADRFWDPSPFLNHVRVWLLILTVSQCGPDEWYVCVEARELATLNDGCPAPDGTTDKDLFYLRCFPGRRRDPARHRRGGAVIPAVAGSWFFWLAIIDGLAAVYIPAFDDRHRPPGGRPRPGHLPERVPRRVARGADPRLPDATQEDKPRSSSVAAVWPVADAELCPTGTPRRGDRGT